MEAEREPLPTRVQDVPALPDAYAVALERGLADLGLQPDATARAAIDGHVRLLLAWTRAINLTAIREPAAVATGHVARQPDGGPLAARPRPPIGSWTSARAAGFPDCRSPRRCRARRSRSSSRSARRRRSFARSSRRPGWPAA